MAPTKFGLFKARSRDQAEQPSTENLLQSSSEFAGIPGSPIPSTSKGMIEDTTPDDISELHIDSEDEQSATSTRRGSIHSRTSENQMNYHPLRNVPSSDLANEDLKPEEGFFNDDSTSIDCNSIQFDISSVAPSEDMSVYCGHAKRKKTKLSNDEQLVRDLDMWHASNVEVMQNLLSRSGTSDEQIKWEAIATARGLCTLTDSCTCHDCKKTKYLAGVTDGDGGLGAAPLFNAINVGCTLQ